MKASTKLWMATGLTVCVAAVAAFTLWVPNESRPVMTQAEPVVARTQDPAPAKAPIRVAEPLAAAPVKDQEGQLFAQAEASLHSDPSRAIALAQKGDAEFPRGPLSDERQLLKLRARVNLNQIPEARVDATNYLEHNPRSPIAPRIHRLLGIHPPPQMGPGN